jgi:hypothetical protein
MPPEMCVSVLVHFPVSASISSPTRSIGERRFHVSTSARFAFA